MGIGQATVLALGAPGLALKKAQEKAEEKGSIKNQFERSVAQTKNRVKSGLKTDVVCISGTAASIGAAAAIKKSRMLQDLIGNATEALKQNPTVKRATEVATKEVKKLASHEYVQKATTWVKTLPKPAKAAMAAGLTLTTIVLNVINNKRIYNAGKIDQEYADKAKVEKEQKKAEAIQVFTA